MAFSWSSLPSLGDKIEWKASEQLDELRDNADWLADNAANTADNSGDNASNDSVVDAIDDSGNNPTYYNTANNPQYTTDDSGHDVTVDSNQHYGYDSTLRTTYCTTDFGNVKNPLYNSYNGSWSDIRLKKDIIYI